MALTGDGTCIQLSPESGLLGLVEDGSLFLVATR